MDWARGKDGLAGHHAKTDAVRMGHHSVRLLRAPIVSCRDVYLAANSCCLVVELSD